MCPEETVKPYTNAALNSRCNLGGEVWGWDTFGTQYKASETDTCITL